MKVFVKQSVLVLAIIGHSLYAKGNLTITNTTLGLLKIQITRNNQVVFTSSAIAPGSVYIKPKLLATSDQIDFKIADNTIGPVLPSHIVGNLFGRTADVVITCRSDQCDIQEM